MINKPIYRPVAYIYPCLDVQLCNIVFIFNVFFLHFLFKVICGLQQPVKQPPFAVVKQSVKDRLGPLPEGNMEHTHSQVMPIASIQVCTVFFFFFFLSY